MVRDDPLGRGGYDDMDVDGAEVLKDLGKPRSKEKSRCSRREDRDRRSRYQGGSKEREKEGKDLDKERGRDGRKDDRDKVSDRDGKEKDHGTEKENERERGSKKDGERGWDKERGKDNINNSRDKERERDTRANDRERENEREKLKGRDKDREHDRERVRGKERSRRQRDEGGDRSKDLGKDGNIRAEGEEFQYKDVPKQGTGLHIGDDDIGAIKQDVNADSAEGLPQKAVSHLEEHISKMKEDRLKKKPEGSSDILSWVTKSRKLEEKRNEKEKALQLSKLFEEQENINQEDSEDEAGARVTSAYVLVGMKVLHGIDKVIEGGAVVLTLEDQSILANGDINEDADILQNVEIGEQKQRDDAYKAAKKKTEIYVDNDDLGSEKKMLPQHDDPVAEEGVTLDAAGRFSAEAEKKPEELRRRIDGVSTAAHFEDLTSSGKITSDYYTQEEMLRFKNPKKKKLLRKKEKLDLDALEAEALSAGLGVGDLGSRTDGKRQALKEEQEKSEAEKRSSAYKSAYARADETSKALRLEQRVSMLPMEEDCDQVFGDDGEDLQKSLERARKLALEKQIKGITFAPQAIALLVASSAKNSVTENEKTTGDSHENKVVFTEMEEFVSGLQLDEEVHKPGGEDVFMGKMKHHEPWLKSKKMKMVVGQDKHVGKDDTPPEYKEEIAIDETIHEVAVGKGLSGALHLLKERGTLKESTEWGGRNMDRKKSKLVCINENNGTKEIYIERLDEYGRTLTEKEAFRILSHKFHGKGPGKMKQEKRMRQYQEELKIKHMKNADTPSLSVERMRKAQVSLKTPYLVLSGNVKLGQMSDPNNGFATVEKDFPGGLTPMLGDRKVKHFLGIKRKPGDMGPPKKPKIYGSLDRR